MSVNRANTREKAGTVKLSSEKNDLKQVKQKTALPVKLPENEEIRTEDSGAKVVTKKAAVKAPVPIAIILCSVLITAVFMYMLSLYVQIEEYNLSIADLQSQVSELKEESTQLEVQLESRYDLDEVGRIATEQYGMVSADSLPKRYISVSGGEDVCEKVGSEGEENGISKLFSGFISALKDLFA